MSDQHLIAAIKSSLHEYEGCEDLVNTLGDDDWQKFERAMPGLKERAKTLVELVNSARYLFAKRPLSFDKKASKLLNEEAKATLAQLAQKFESIDNWTVETIEQSMRDFSQEQDIKLGKIAQPLRAALTGCTISPGIFDVLFVLGKDESLARLADIK